MKQVPSLASMLARWRFGSCGRCGANGELSLLSLHPSRVCGACIVQLAELRDAWERRYQSVLKASLEGDLMADEWKCPKCRAVFGECGKGACKTQESSCDGLVCECDSDASETHGTQPDPCLNARCRHCGWSGNMPPDIEPCPTCKGSGHVRKAGK